MCLGFRRINMAMIFGQSQSAVHSFVFINTKKYVKIPPENGLHRDFLRNCLPHEENSRMLLAKEFVNHVVLFLILKKKKPQESSLSCLLPMHVEIQPTEWSLMRRFLPQQKCWISFLESL